MSEIRNASTEAKGKLAVLLRITFLLYIFLEATMDPKDSIRAWFQSGREDVPIGISLSNPSYRSLYRDGWGGGAVCACVHLGVTARNICCWCSTKGMMGMKWGPALAQFCFSMGPFYIVDATALWGPSGMCGLYSPIWLCCAQLGTRVTLSLMPEHEVYAMCKHL